MSVIDETKAVPIYALGKADPIAFQKRKPMEILDLDSSETEDHSPKFSRTVNFPEGIDYQVFIDDENYGHIQAICVHSNKQDISTGTLIVVGSPGFNFTQDILAKKDCSIVVRSKKDAFGYQEIAFQHKVHIDGYDWNVSIDDIVTETMIRFTILN